MPQVLASLIAILFPSGVSPNPAAFALLALRLFVGLAFIQHGLGKWHDLPGFADEFSIPLWMAGLAAASQVGAAAALIVGFATPLAALTIGGNMAVAVLKLIGRGESFVNPHGHSWESAGGYAVLGLALFLLGPGAYSLDRILFSRWLPRRP